MCGNYWFVVVCSGCLTIVILFIPETPFSVDTQKQPRTICLQLVFCHRILFYFVAKESDFLNTCIIPLYIQDETRILTMKAWKI